MPLPVTSAAEMRGDTDVIANARIRVEEAEAELVAAAREDGDL